MARKSERMKLYEEKLSSKMTVGKLKDYIRRATAEVNKSIKKRGTGSEILDKSINYLKKRGGIVKRGGIERVGLGFKGKKKADLYEQARLLKSHFNIDISTKQGKEFLSEREEKAYKTFKKDRDINLTKAEYRQVVEIFGQLGDTVVKKLTSTEIANLYAEVSDIADQEDVVSIIIQEFSNAQGKGITRKKLLKLIRQRLKEELE